MTHVLQRKNIKSTLQKTERNKHGLKNRTIITTVRIFFLLALQPIVGLYSQPSREAIASSRTRFLDHTQRRATVGRTPLDE
jgi:hypothetical protein